MVQTSGKSKVCFVKIAQVLPGPIKAGTVCCTELKFGVWSFLNCGPKSVDSEMVGYKSNSFG